MRSHKNPSESVIFNRNVARSLATADAARRHSNGERKSGEICRLHLSGIKGAAAILSRCERSRHQPYACVRSEINESPLPGGSRISRVRGSGCLNGVHVMPDIYSGYIASPFSMFRLLQVSNLISCTAPFRQRCVSRGGAFLSTTLESR
jgi:hypothetical protein